MTTADGLIPFNQAEAKRETAEAKAMVTDLAVKLDRLHRHQAHTALGYSTWAKYVVGEFGQEIGVRRSYQLLTFHALRSEIEEQIGAELPGLKEKDVRGMGSEEAAKIAADVNEAKKNGEDLDKAARDSAAKHKPEGRRRGPRLPDGGTKPSTKEAPPTEEPVTAPTMDELLAATTATAVPTTAVPLPVRLIYSYEAWMQLTLACRDERDAGAMREHFAALVDKVDLAIRTNRYAAERQSA